MLGRRSAGSLLSRSACQAGPRSKSIAMVTRSMAVSASSAI
jgi:hypothetical protein